MDADDVPAESLPAATGSGLGERREGASVAQNLNMGISRTRAGEMILLTRTTTTFGRAMKTSW